jgi:hypothetical protein
MANCGLTNELADVHSEQVPNTHVRGSTQIHFTLVSDGIWPCIKSIGILDESILKRSQSNTYRSESMTALWRSTRKTGASTLPKSEVG